MNLDRFQTLAEAYGGSIPRWPAEDQDAAFALLAASPDVAGRALAQARDLDEAMDAAHRLTPAQDLRRRILNAAPQARSVRAPVQRWFAGAGVGVGLAAVAVAGLMLGVNLSVASAGEDAMLLATVYGSDLADVAGGDS